MKISIKNIIKNICKITENQNYGDNSNDLVAYYNNKE